MLGQELVKMISQGAYDKAGEMGMRGFDAPMDPMQANMGRRVEEPTGGAVGRAIGQGALPAPTAEQDAMARRAGFRDYAQMRAYMARRQEAEGGVRQEKGTASSNALSWHPSNLLNYVVDKISGARGD